MNDRHHGQLDSFPPYVGGDEWQATCDCGFKGHKTPHISVAYGQLVAHLNTAFADFVRELGQVEGAAIWRVGRKVGRTIYLQRGAEPSYSDPLIGMMDSRELAELVVKGVAALRQLGCGNKNDKE